ncbi:teneurin-m isoform X2 [Apis mellifera caucasica]|nr:teneurin-m isoform X2 [Apis mellifera caucasica]
MDSEDAVVPALVVVPEHAVDAAPGLDSSKSLEKVNEKKDGAMESEHILDVASPGSSKSLEKIKEKEGARENEHVVDVALPGSSKSLKEIKKEEERARENEHIVDVAPLDSSKFLEKIKEKEEGGRESEHTVDVAPSDSSKSLEEINEKKEEARKSEHVVDVAPSGSSKSLEEVNKKEGERENELVVDVASPGSSSKFLEKIKEKKERARESEHIVDTTSPGLGSSKFLKEVKKEEERARENEHVDVAPPDSSKSLEKIKEKEDGAIENVHVIDSPSSSKSLEKIKKEEEARKSDHVIDTAPPGSSKSLEKIKEKKEEARKSDHTIYTALPGSKSLESGGKSVESGGSGNSSDFSGVVKETRELPRDEDDNDSSPESGWPSRGKSYERSEELLQRDYPSPIYNYNGQDEVEFVKLNQTMKNNDDDDNNNNNNDDDDRGSFGDDEVKTNDVPRRASIGDLRVITREESDEEFLREFERKFREEAEIPSADKGREGGRDDASVESNSAESRPPTHQVKIIEVPVDRPPLSSTSSSSSSSSSHRVLVNITIASGDSASSKPLYVLSVSVPTSGDGAVHDEERPIGAEGGKGKQQMHEERPTAEQETSSSSGRMAAKIARDPSEGNDDRLPPPPQPPSSPPPPIWAGGECECSCPCMGSSSDEWDNDFSPVDETPLNLDAGREEHYATRNASEETASDARQVEGRRREEEGSSVRSVSSEEEEEVKGETSSQHDYVSGSEENSSTIDWTTSNYESESSGVSSVSGCSGTTPLPPEPTILILEGEYINGECQCNPGWKGKECSLRHDECEVPDCNGHGHCTNGKCNCVRGYKGKYCEEVDCPHPTCSGHGFCAEGTCICKKGWKGADCSQMDKEALQCLPDCSGHGNFDLETQTCLCEPMWSGDDCSKELCDLDCGPHGHCVDNACDCLPGWSGELCNLKQCDPRCNEHGQCKNGTCLCVTGWNGKHCTMEGCPNSCSGHGQCRVSNDGQWECRCYDGWDGKDCNVLLEQNCNDGRDNDKVQLVRLQRSFMYRIENHLKQLGYVQKLDTWVPHELKEKHLTRRINNCDLLKKRNENDPFLKQVITGDEKWVVYNNIKRKRWWSRPREPARTTSKAGIRRKKVLLSVWWDYEGIVYFELLPPNRTINSVVYIEQLTKLNNAVEEKRPELTNRKGVVFHRDDARPHASLVTRQKLLELGWDVSPHPPYSPDLAPSDYFLFRSLQNFSNGKNFNNDDDIESYLIQFFA